MQQADLSEQLVSRGDYVPQCLAHVALVAAAIETYESELAVELAQFYASAARGRPHVSTQVGRTVALRYCGHAYSLNTCRLGRQQYRILADGTRVDCHIDHINHFESWLTCFGQRFHLVSAAHGPSYRVEVDGFSHFIERDDSGVLQAPSPSVVVSIAVKPGDRVEAGDRLAVLEAMKLETELVAPFSGTVRRVMTMPNMQVDAGTPLLQIDDTTGTEAATEERVLFSPSLSSAANDMAFSRCRESLEELRHLALGFDVDASQTSRLFADWSQHCPAASEYLRTAEDEILSIFADTCALFDRQVETDDFTGTEVPSAESSLFSYLSYLLSLDISGKELRPTFFEALLRALAHYGVSALDRSPELEECLFWIFKSHQRIEQQAGAIFDVLERRLHWLAKYGPPSESFRLLLNRLIAVSRGLFPGISDLAREIRYRHFDQPLFERARQQVYAEMENHLDHLSQEPDTADRRERIRALIECPQPLVSFFSAKFATANVSFRRLLLEVLTWRYYRIRTLVNFRILETRGYIYASAEYDHEDKRIHVFTAYANYSQLMTAATAMFPLIAQVPADHDVVLDFYLENSASINDPDITERQVHSMLNQAGFPRAIRRIVVIVAGNGHGRGALQHFTFRPSGAAYEEEKLYRGIHPMIGNRLHLWRLSNFHIERLPSGEDVYLLRGVARDNPKDERLFACAEVRDTTPVRDLKGRIVQLPHLERMLMEAAASIRQFQSHRKAQDRLHWNRILLYVWPPLDLQAGELHEIIQKLAPETQGLGLEQLVIRARIPNSGTDELRDTVVEISCPGSSGLLITFRPAINLQPIRSLTEYERKVIRMRQRGLIYPYEIVNMLTPAPGEMHAEFPPGDFVEHDLDSSDRLVPVDRPYGQNNANIIAGVIRNCTPKYPEGMTRIMLLGDPSRDLGALAEPECRRIIAALNLAEERGLPLEWFPISAGARISMESGVENMDWIARVLRRLVEFTQAGGEVNLIVNGINVGAQPYWNAEATMLMHNRGILVMTPKAAMVLTGKRALEYSGSVSAEDNQGIGGYDRIMGLNGQAQYWARDIDEACHILLRHYEHTYVASGERFPRRAMTADPFDRNVCVYPHKNGHENGFATIGDIFSDETNPARKKSFDIRRVMKAVIDQDHHPLERWHGMRAAETAVVWDAHLGGYPVCLIGIESKLVARVGFIPADGPDQWTAGTLFPLSSKKVARAINASSHNRPVVLLANLSGFDGSPESMRKLQLEYGAEIGRAVVNFKGPIIFCVISRYHGGAYVVFSRTLNENLEVVALEGTYASVIGGAPAAGVVFASEVEARTRKDPRLQALTQALAAAVGPERIRLHAQYDELVKIVHSEKLGELAEEFDRVHNVHRALKVGALQRIISPANLRPYLIDAVERGIEKEGKLPSPRLPSMKSQGIFFAIREISDAAKAS
jgi:acetyl-CoA carboxylase carboxyltransferase component